MNKKLNYLYSNILLVIKITSLSIIYKMAPVKSSRSTVVHKSANKLKKNTQVGRRTTTELSYESKVQDTVDALSRLSPRFDPKWILKMSDKLQINNYEYTRDEKRGITNVYRGWIIKNGLEKPRKKIKIRKIQPKDPIQKTLFDFNYTRVRQNKIIRYFFALKK